MWKKKCKNHTRWDTNARSPATTSQNIFNSMYTAPSWQTEGSCQAATDVGRPMGASRRKSNTTKKKKKTEREKNAHLMCEGFQE